MAFTVTPTSGAAPYLLEAEFLGRYGLDAGIYVLRYYRETLEGSCPLPDVSGANQGTPAQSLLNTGSYSLVTSITNGSCQTITLAIRDAVTNDVVSQESVNIDNTV